MENTKGIILLDTYQPRQQTVIQHIKPKEIPHKNILGLREFDDPENYMQHNIELIHTHQKELIAFLQAHPQTTVITNYYFGILSETWDFIKENKENIANVFALTCHSESYKTYAEENNYPIKPENIIISDDHCQWQYELREALHRPY